MATNQVYNYGVQFDVAADSVTAPAEPTSNDPVVIEQLPAVALTDPFTNNAGESRITVKTDGWYDLEVEASNGALDIGHIVHIHATTGALSNTSGVRFGYAMGAVADGATATIPVKIGY